MSYKGMVKTYGNTQFAGNNLRFATEEEATAYTKNLAKRMDTSNRLDCKEIRGRSKLHIQRQ